MSRRTAEATRAVAEAWAIEQQLVLEGQGTRDWTPEQQKDIIERGKAYDADGKAFEGHHMKSAEAYPEYQGNPKNIQFLSRQEHYLAHGGNFQNPTNGFFNPITLETMDFGESEPIPCPVINLSKPYNCEESHSESASEDKCEDEPQSECQTNSEEKADDDSAEITAASTTPGTEEAAKGPTKNATTKVKINSRTKQALGAVKTVGKKAVTWVKEHPGETIAGLGWLAYEAGKIYYSVKSASENGSSYPGDDSRSADSYGEEAYEYDPFEEAPNIEDDESDEDSLDDDETEEDETDEPGHGKPKKPHTRRGHASHVWTGPRDGERKRKEIWIDEIHVNSPPDETDPSEE